MARSKAPSRPGAAKTRDFLGWTGGALLFGLFSVAALGIYWNALEGGFFSDDHQVLVLNPYVQRIDATHLWDIVNPRGGAAQTTLNYAPVHMLLHALEWRVFGSEVFGYHLVNVFVHALAATLLVALLLTSRFPRPVCLLGGAIFLLHPANVEAVAWIFQLKTSAALVLTEACLLLRGRRPALATGLFALALLTKPTAAVALPIAALLDWTREHRLQRKWLGIWALVFCVIGVLEFGLFQQGGEQGPLHADPLVWGRSIVAFAARYLVMAYTTLGLSLFHQPALALSWLDPWWLGGCVALALLGWRTVAGLRERREEAVWWLWAAISFAPISQIFPFIYSLGDRYLYFILPGLIGGSIGLGCNLIASLLGSRDQRQPPRWLQGVATGLVLALVVGLTARSFERATLWRSEALLLSDAARNYPHGHHAHLLSARRAAGSDDWTATADALRNAFETGYSSLQLLVVDPLFARGSNHAAMYAVFRDMASAQIEEIRALEDPDQGQLHRLAFAHLTRQDLDEAVAALERAVEVGGPRTEIMRSELEGARALRARGGRFQPSAPGVHR